MTTFSRRRFLTLTGLGLLASRRAFAIEPFQRKGSARMGLSLAAYSFRDYFKEQQGKPNPKGTIEMTDFIDYCADQGCAGFSPSFPAGAL